MKMLIFTLALFLSGINAFGQSVSATAYRMYASNTERWDGTVWEETDSSHYFYGNGKQDTLFYSYSWNSVNLEWEVAFRRYYTFDNNGNVILYLTQLWDGTLFTNYIKEERTYNAYNQIEAYTSYSWDGANWVPALRYSYTFNAQGKITAETREGYNSGTWVNESRSVYTYSGNFASIVEAQSWVSGAWKKVHRIVYTRDAQGNPLVYLYQSWDGATYNNSYQYLRTFDANNNLLTDMYVNWNGTAWDSINRHSYTYNAANKVLLDLRQIHPSGNWTDESRKIYTYLNDVLLDTILQQSWTSGNWTNVQLNTQQYDLNDNYVYGEYLTWNSGAWVNGYRYFNYYEAYDAVGINDPKLDLGATVYPNPFAETVNFKLPLDASGRVEIQLFDISGKNVLVDNQFITAGQQLFSISTGNLPAGTYVFVLTLDGKQSRGLITK